jgi:methylenetetrahydrofolate dehydrogenase (NADP+)/methenyltetrahydrofolate cyclohydrolase
MVLSPTNQSEHFVSAQILDGKAVADRAMAAIADEVGAMRRRGLRPPSLTTIRVGEDPASAVYVRNKHLACRKVGIDGVAVELPSSTSQQELLEIIDGLNADRGVDGILVQLPLPAQIDSVAILQRIDPAKDVDGFHPFNVGCLMQRTPGLRPCTPYGVIELLKETGETFYGRRAVVVGASNIVGRPMAMELLLAGAIVTVTHRFTRDLQADVSGAEILVVAAGKPNLVRGDWIPEGATVIDVGIHRGADGKLHGDVEFEVARRRAAWITPVPGGVGPMTVAMLMRNTLQAARANLGVAGADLPPGTGPL